MATRKGPKVEPHENLLIKKQVIEVAHEKEEITSKNEAQIFGEDVILPPTDGNLDAEVEMMKLIEEAGEPIKSPKEFHFEFQDEYHFGPGNGDAVIDTLPEEPKCACADPNCECKDDEKCDEKCDKDCTCDLTLPAEEPYIPLMVTEAPKKKTLEQMTACEINIYKKTGIIPFV